LRDKFIKRRTTLIKYNWSLPLAILLGVIGFACEPEVEVTVEKETKTTTGPQTEQITIKDYSEAYYVADNAGSDEDGNGSKEKPWASVNFALSQISIATADSRVALLVSEGDYSKSTIQMKEYIDLYGGFSEKDWTRDIEKVVVS
jgi:hypothetical protein